MLNRLLISMFSAAGLVGCLETNPLHDGLHADSGESATTLGEGTATSGMDTGTATGTDSSSNGTNATNATNATSATSATAGDGDGDSTNSGDGDTTSTGDGDGGGNVCEPVADDPVCMECMKAFCCESWIACEANEGCACMLECIRFLPSNEVSACQNQCQNVDNGAVAGMNMCMLDNGSPCEGPCPAP